MASTVTDTRATDAPVTDPRVAAAITASVPTRQRDPWQAMADRAMAGWTTH
jgi:hypothetical protein